MELPKISPMSVGKGTYNSAKNIETSSEKPTGIKDGNKKLALMLAGLGAAGVAAVAIALKLKKGKSIDLADFKAAGGKFEEGIAKLKNGKTFSGIINHTGKTGDKFVMEYADGKILNSTKTVLKDMKPETVMEKIYGRDHLGNTVAISKKMHVADGEVTYPTKFINDMRIKALAKNNKLGDYSGDHRQFLDFCNGKLDKENAIAVKGGIANLKENAKPISHMDQVNSSYVKNKFAEAKEKLANGQIETITEKSADGTTITKMYAKCNEISGEDFGVKGVFPQYALEGIKRVDSNGVVLHSELVGSGNIRHIYYDPAKNVASMVNSADPSHIESIDASYLATLIQ